MNDFDFDCLEKKRLARSAFARKGTRNRKGCRLPHENLTKKELEKMNGEIKTVGFNDRITWGLFKLLPKDLQEEYIQKQIDRFGVGMTAISRDLFGQSKTALEAHCRRQGLNIKSKSGRVSIKNQNRWKDWLNGLNPDPEPSSAPVSEIAEDPVEEDLIEPVENVPPFRAHDYEDMFKECGMEREAGKPDDEKEFAIPYPLQDLNLTLEGTPVEIMTTLANAIPTLLDKDKTYRFSIKVDAFFLTHGDRTL